MKITSVIGSESCRGIPLKGWDSVKAALQAYSEGKAQGARATTNHQLDAVGQGPHGGMAVALTLFAGVLAGRPDEFVERMLKQAEPAVRKNGHWGAHYDYDAMGTNFFKTSVDIDLRDKENDIYVLKINAAYVGDEPEQGLADFLGVPRTLLSKSVVITTEPLNEMQFAIDFSELYIRAGFLLCLDSEAGHKIAAQMMTGDRYSSPPSFVLKDDGDVRVTVSLGRVQSRYRHDGNGSSLDTWKTDGSILIGFLDHSYEDRSKKEPPTFVITVSKKQNEEERGYSPVWDAELRSKIVNLADKIGKAMMST
ncbi:MAG: hypothetical protein Q8P21_02865 [bacterium]|nr:hypothetical protein [bacterium]